MNATPRRLAKTERPEWPGLGEIADTLIGPAAAMAVAARIGFSPAYTGFGADLLIGAAGLLPLLLWLLSSALGGRPARPRKIVLWPIALFAVAVAVSPLFASYKFGAVKTALVWLPNLALLLAVANSRRDAWRLVLAAAVAGMVVTAAEGAFFVVEGSEYLRTDSPLLRGEELGDRPSRPLTNLVTENVLASFLLLFGPLLAARILSGREAGWWRVALLAPFVLTAFCFFLCRSAGGFLAGGLALSVFFFTALRTKGRRKMLIAGGCVAGLALLVIVLAGTGVSPLDRLMDVRSVDVRRTYWKATLSIIGESPVGGTGLGNFDDAYVQHREPSPEEITDPHNSVLKMFAELGVLGGIPFLLAWTFLLRPRFRRLPDAKPETVRIEFGALMTGLFCLGVILYPLMANTFDYRSPWSGLATAIAVGLWVVTFYGMYGIRASAAHRALLAGLCGALAHSLLDQQFAVPAMSMGLWLTPGLLVAMSAQGKVRDKPLPGSIPRLLASLPLAVAIVCMVLFGFRVRAPDRLWQTLPADADAAYRRAMILRESADEGQRLEGKRLLERAIRLRPERGHYHSDYATYLLVVLQDIDAATVLGDPREKNPAKVLSRRVRDEFREAVRLNPYSLDKKERAPLQRLAWFYDAMGEKEKAETTVREILRIDKIIRRLYPERALTEEMRKELEAKVGEN